MEGQATIEKVESKIDSILIYVVVMQSFSNVFIVDEPKVLCYLDKPTSCICQCVHLLLIELQKDEILSILVLLHLNY